MADKVTPAPCPFCGGSDLIDSAYGNPPIARILCVSPECHAHGPQRTAETEAEAIAAAWEAWDAAGKA